MNTVLSLPGTLLLVINLMIFYWSFRFMEAYNTSMCTKKQNLMPGSYFVMIHAQLEQLIGLFAAFLFFSAFLMKMIGLFSFLICPRKIYWLKVKMYKGKG